MSERLDIAEEVAAALPDEQLTQIVDTREHTEIRCFVCQRFVPPESDEPVSVVAFMDPLRAHILFAAAHTDCMRSQVVVLDVPVESIAASARNTVWTSLLRDELPPGPVLLWETSATLWRPGASGFDANTYLSGLFERGFARVTESVFRLTAPPLAGCRLEWAGEDLVLCYSDGEAETFSGASGLVYPEWRDALEQERCCLLLAGIPGSAWSGRRSNASMRFSRRGRRSLAWPS